MSRHLPFPLFCLWSIAVLFASSLPAQTPSPSPSPAPPRRPNLNVAPPRQSSTPCGRHVGVCDLLDQYASLTKFKIIRDNFVQGQVSVDDVTTLPAEKAIWLIERSLFGDGFAMIQIAPDTVQILGLGKSAKGIGVPVVSDPSKVPENERLISYLFAFKYRSAVEMQQIFGQYTSPPRPYTHFVASDPKGSNTLLATERSSVIRSLIEIANKMDVPDAAGTP